MRILCATVVAAAMTVAAPMQVLASEAAASPATPETRSIATAADRAVRGATLKVERSDVPVPRPYQGRDRSRKQMGGGGGGKSGMIIGVVSMLAGTAATVYMVKAMKDSQKQAATAPQ